MEDEKEFLKVLIEILSELKIGLEDIHSGIKSLEEGINRLEKELIKEEDKLITRKAEREEVKIEKDQIILSPIFYRPLSERVKKISESPYKDTTSEKIREVLIGRGEKAIKVGGENVLPFYLFEGTMGNEIKIAMEILDVKPEDWPESLAKYFSDVFHDPALWAKKCVQVYGAEAICLYLQGTDPNYLNLDSNHAKEAVKKVLDAIDVPLIVWGSGNPEKDLEIFREIAELLEKKGAAIGPVLEANYRTLGAIAIGYNLPVIASTPIDVNLAKQLNILLENMGVSLDKVLIDPSIGALGYGIEYTYSVMERIRIAALYYKDTALQSPFVCTVGREVWGTKEVQLPTDDVFGDKELRGILMEAITSVMLALAGGDLLIMRHPKAIQLCKNLFDELSKE